MAELAGAACFKWSQDKAVLLGVDPFEFRYGLLPYLDELCHIRRILSLYVMVVGSTGLFLPFMGLTRPSRPLWRMWFSMYPDRRRGISIWPMH